MSYRELRNFKEIMATLGYPRLISIENFKVPNFDLVKEVLLWLCKRYDKNMEILDETRTVQDRVVFLKSVAEELLVKARIKLNLKNLYASNGFAVRELLKLASLLHEAHRNAKADPDDTDDTTPADIGPGHKFADLKLTRSLSSDITKYGAHLDKLLGSHSDTKEAAARALGKNFDIDTLQKHLHREVEAIREQAEQMDATLQNVEQDKSNLEAKIEKKKTELERSEKRFQSLQTVRPAFMDEYERLEAELSAQYSLYVQSWRNLSYLENELDVINALEQEKIAENDRQLKHMQKRLREEELRILRGQAKVDEKALDDALLESNMAGARAIKRPGAANSRRDGRGGSAGDFDGSDLQGGAMPMREDSGDEGEEEEESGEEDEEEDSDGQGAFNQDEGEEDDDLDDLEASDDELEDGEEDDIDDGNF
ncbi:hypothetical protein AB1Y20_018141 [Prymnesium parvum]|uniref:Clusterin-associated protein 1 n=1 Tax=Prymnesium parvum TaxID=97485 RepID=A0AB34JN67_PRYPA|mmetsp:Transcript_37934/g.94269  ORF Transcript_37934/g.94269 Transcript_37934/m.94269 type:complete len:426 (+) Transcript_37934:72-1349(+)